MTFGDVDGFGSYDRAKNRLTLSASLAGFAAEDSGLGGVAVYAYLEELGHWADARLQQLAGQDYVDPAGDEGARFANRSVAALTEGRGGDISVSLALAEGGYTTISANTTALKITALSSIATGRVNAENVVNGTQMFGADGHFGQTFLVAFGAGRSLGLNPRSNLKLARDLAVLSQVADMFAQFDAKSLGLKKAGAYGNAFADASDGVMSSPLQWSDRDENYLRTIYNGLHAIPTSGEVTGDWINRERIKTETYIVDRMASGDFVRAGIALHRYGDLFAHVQGINQDQPYTDKAGHTVHSLTGRDPDSLFGKNWKGEDALVHTKKT